MKYVAWSLVCLASIGVVHGSRTAPEWTVLTPVHIWMADIGLIEVGEVGYLKNIGKVSFAVNAKCCFGCFF